MSDLFVCDHAHWHLVTKGDKCSSLLTNDSQVDVPAVEPHKVVDPTGVGDAFRGGLMKGMALGLPYDMAARLGSVAAAYALEHLGGLSHAYTWDEFKKRYEQHFGSLTSTSPSSGNTRAS
jgi:adenosine kinase